MANRCDIPTQIRSIERFWCNAHFEPSALLFLVHVKLCDGEASTIGTYRVAYMTVFQNITAVADGYAPASSTRLGMVEGYNTGNAPLMFDLHHLDVIG